MALASCCAVPESMLSVNNCTCLHVDGAAGPSSFTNQQFGEHGEIKILLILFEKVPGRIHTFF